MVHQPAHTKTEHAFNPEAPVAQHINAFFIFNVVTLLWLLEIVPSGADGGASAEASGPATQKALPPWMLRQGITSTTLPLEGSHWVPHSCKPMVPVWAAVMMA
jgi:hypothetical protein